MSTIAVTAPDQTVSTRLYRSVWRWHFYAGLVVVPFLMVSALTGIVMLYGNSIETFLGAKHYVAPGGERASLVAQAEAATAAVPAGVGGLGIALFALIDFLLPKRLKEAGAQAAGA